MMDALFGQTFQLGTKPQQESDKKAKNINTAIIAV